MRPGLLRWNVSLKLEIRTATGDMRQCSDPPTDEQKYWQHCGTVIHDAPSLLYCKDLLISLIRSAVKCRGTRSSKRKSLKRTLKSWQSKNLTHI